MGFLYVLYRCRTKIIWNINGKQQKKLEIITKMNENKSTLRFAQWKSTTEKWSKRNMNSDTLNKCITSIPERTGHEWLQWNIIRFDDEQLSAFMIAKDTFYLSNFGPKNGHSKFQRNFSHFTKLIFTLFCIIATMYSLNQAARLCCGIKANGWNFVKEMSLRLEKSCNIPVHVYRV